MKYGFRDGARRGLVWSSRRVTTARSCGMNVWARGGARRASGFTLLELIVVMTLIGLLVGIALPAYRDATRRAKEATLRQDLARMRVAIDEYHTDKGVYPPALEDLVSVGYLRTLPQDPITRSDSTWVLEYAPWEMVDEGQIAGVFNVRSGAEGEGLAGTPYSEW